MGDAGTKFVIFAVFSAVMLVVGYTARRRRWLNEHLSRPIHLHTVLWVQGPVALISFWNLQINRQLALVMALQPLVMLACWAVAATAARAMRWPREQAGVVSLCAALSNQGFTLGAYLCLTLLTPGKDAMSYAIAYVTSMQLFMVLIFYPVARHYGPGDTQALPRMILQSFTDIRALPLYMAVAGIALSALAIPVPRWITPQVMDVFFFAGAVGSYLGIGLRLRVAESRRFLPHHALLAVARFGVCPLVTLTLVMGLGMIGTPLAPLPTKVVMIESFMPAAINAVIIANIFHLDARLASVLWLWSTVLFCVIPLPVILLMA